METVLRFLDIEGITPKEIAVVILGIILIFVIRRLVMGKG